MVRRTDTRDRILTAAEDVVLRDGVLRLTLDAAAAEAGVSKGGVLYHFPSRDALCSAILDRVVSQFDAFLAERSASDGEPGAFSRAYIAGGFDESVTDSERRYESLGAAMLLAAVGQPALRGQLRDAFDRWQSALEADGLSSGRALLIRLALDGLWVLDVLGLSALDDAGRQALRAEIDELIR